jgi:hypothetical protein
MFFELQSICSPMRHLGHPQVEKIVRFAVPDMANQSGCASEGIRKKAFPPVHPTGFAKAGK